MAALNHVAAGRSGRRQSVIPNRVARSSNYFYAAHFQCIFSEEGCEKFVVPNSTLGRMEHKPPIREVGKSQTALMMNWLKEFLFCTSRWLVRSWWQYFFRDPSQPPINLMWRIPRVDCLFDHVTAQQCGD